MSKSLGNVVDPSQLLREYGVDPVRYFLLRDGSLDGDGDYSVESLNKRFLSDLADNLGNLGNECRFLQQQCCCRFMLSSALPVVHGVFCCSLRSLR